MAVTNHVFWSGSCSDVPNRPILAKPTPESRCQKRLFAWLLFSLFSPLAVACIGRSLATAGLHVGLVHASVTHTLIDVLCQVSCVFGTCLRGGFIFLTSALWWCVGKGFQSSLSSRLASFAFSPFSFAHTLLVLLAKGRRERCNCRWSLVFFGFLPSNSAFLCIVRFWEGWNSVARMMLEEFFCFCFPFWSLQLPRFVFLLCGVSSSWCFFFPFFSENAFVSVNTKRTNKQANIDSDIQQYEHWHRICWKWELQFIHVLGRGREISEVAESSGTSLLSVSFFFKVFVARLFFLRFGLSFFHRCTEEGCIFRRFIRFVARLLHRSLFCFFVPKQSWA